jgi:hypothetical protein
MLHGPTDIFYKQKLFIKKKIIMPITSSNPIEIDGKIYPNYLLNLSMSPLYGHDKIGQSVALRLTPERVEDGVSIQSPENAKNILILDVFKDIANGDEDLRIAVEKITETLQEFINSRGL